MIVFMGLSEKQLTEAVVLWEQHNKMPTKHIMTRAEAISEIRHAVFGLTDTGQAAKWVDFFIDAGMLKIKEEETSFAFAIQQHNLVPKNISLSCVNNILAAISAMGYEIKAK